MNTCPSIEVDLHRRGLGHRTAHVLAVLVTALACVVAWTTTTTVASASSIAAGERQTCAIKSGEVWCWGSGQHGLGDGSTSESAVPVRVHGLGHVEEVAVGYGHACARQTDRTVWCWGANFYGQLGNDTTGTNAPTPVPVAGIADAMAIDAGDEHSCAVRTNGRVACWGNGGAGRLGDGSTTDRPIPVEVDAITGARDVAAGEEHSCAVTVTGATKATKKHSVRKTVPVRLAPTANCHVTTSVRLPRSLRRAKAVAVAVRGSGLTTTTRKVRVT